MFQRLSIRAVPTVMQILKISLRKLMFTCTWLHLFPCLLVFSSRLAYKPYRILFHV